MPDNKDKEGAFEITHVAKRVNFELAQKLQNSLYYVKARNILKNFEIKSGELGKSALNDSGKARKVTQSGDNDHFANTNTNTNVYSNMGCESRP